MSFGHFGTGAEVSGHLHLHSVVSLSILSADMRYVLRAIRLKQFRELLKSDVTDCGDSLHIVRWDI